VGQRQASVVRERDELLHDADAALVAHRGVPLDLLGAVAKLCIPPLGTDDNSRANRMVAMLIDGLRYGANLDGLRYGANLDGLRYGANPGPPQIADD
jgi:hypothetical protein